MDYAEKESYVIKKSKDWNLAHPKHRIIVKYKDILGAKIAEFGGNSGYHCFLAAQLEGVEEVWCFDIQKEALEHGDTVYRKRFDHEIESKVFFKEQDLLTLNGPLEKFDTIISFHTLEHIYPKDLQTVLLNMRKTLKPNGHFIVTVPLGSAHYSKEHVNFFSKKSLEEKIVAAGFDIKEIYIDKSHGQLKNKLCVTAVCIRNSNDPFNSDRV